MILSIDGQIVRIEPATRDFIERLVSRTGTPANEIISAILNGHMGGTV